MSIQVAPDDALDLVQEDFARGFCRDRLSHPTATMPPAMELDDDYLATLARRNMRLEERRQRREKLSSRQKPAEYYR